MKNALDSASLHKRLEMISSYLNEMKTEEMSNVEFLICLQLIDEGYGHFSYDTYHSFFYKRLATKELNYG